MYISMFFFQLKYPIVKYNFTHFLQVERKKSLLFAFATLTFENITNKITQSIHVIKFDSNKEDSCMVTNVHTYVYEKEDCNSTKRNLNNFYFETTHCRCFNQISLIPLNCTLEHNAHSFCLHPPKNSHNIRDILIY